jgi:hypothetical protein
MRIDTELTALIVIMMSTFAVVVYRHWETYRFLVDQCLATTLSRHLRQNVWHILFQTLFSACMVWLLYLVVSRFLTWIGVV